jgi:multimeric flavodoxin WrbA
MNKPKKILFISGSPRKGNTGFVLTEIFKVVNDADKELILLREKNIGFCRGCLACHNQPKCIIKDDMNAVLDKIVNADILVIGSPNYFDNVSGLMKNFIDRAHPLYKKELARGKKLILIYVGAGEKPGTKKYLDLAFYGFVKYLKLRLLGSYAFQALNVGDLKNKNINKEIEKIVKKII